MDHFMLKLFFCELIKLGFDHPGTIGNPVSWLIEQMCVYQDNFIKRILGDYTGNSHESRLNNAGLKMYWKVEGGEFKCRISGDQAKDYLFFVAAANRVIKKYKFNWR